MSRSTIVARAIEMMSDGEKQHAAAATTTTTTTTTTPPTPPTTTTTTPTQTPAQTTTPTATTPTELRIAVVGNVDSGKSTLIGVLTSGVRDDGRGLARSRVFLHDHESKTGRTSAVSHHMMGFRRQQQPEQPMEALFQTATAQSRAVAKSRSWQEIVEHAQSTVTFIDLAGHEDYLRTTITGLTADRPHCVAVVVNSLANGIPRMTREHLQVVTALNLPYFVVVTKIDQCPLQVMRETRSKLRHLIKSSLPADMMVQPVDIVDLHQLSTLHMHNTQQQQQQKAARKCPIFYIDNVRGFSSNKTKMEATAAATVSSSCSQQQQQQQQYEPMAGDKVTVNGLDCLLLYLHQLSAATAAPTDAVAASAAATAAATTTNAQHQRFEMRISNTFVVVGAGGPIVSGNIVSGQIVPGTICWLGPFSTTTTSDQQQSSSYEYRLVDVRTVHRRRFDDGIAQAGQTCSSVLRYASRTDAARIMSAAAAHTNHYQHPKTELLRNHINHHHGMVLLGLDTKHPWQMPIATLTFWSEIFVMHHSTTIQPNYQAVIHSENIRQAAVLLQFRHAADWKDKDGVCDDGEWQQRQQHNKQEWPVVLRSNDRAKVQWRFLVRPEYLRCGMVFIFREGTAKGVGRITDICKSPTMVTADTDTDVCRCGSLYKSSGNF